MKLCSLLFCVALLAGCSSSYVLRGRAVEGGYSDITIVSGENAGNEAGAPLAGVLVKVYRDPNRMNQALVASGRTASDGTIDIQLDAFGAGWMEEVWLIEVYREGYELVERTVRLPASSSGREILITLRAGRDGRPISEDSVLEQYERFK